MVLDDVNALGAARRDVLDTLGAEALVDACGVAATFNAIDRVADGGISNRLCKSTYR